MKIVIVENPRPLTVEHYNDVANAPLSASLNSGYALAVARRAGWDIAYLDFSSRSKDASAIAAYILAESADIVLFHWVYSWGHEELVRTVMDLVRRESTAPLGAFGLFPTLSRNRLLQFAPQLDFILAGEFERTLAELLSLFEVRRSVTVLPGVAMRDAEFVQRPLLADLARLPVPDDVGANCGYATLNIAASRGCYGDCSFCFINSFYGCNRRRVRSLASLERELERRLLRRGIKSLYFIDPTFIGHGDKERERAAEIGCMAKSFGLPFGFETRVDSIEKRLLATLADNGATSVFLGIESGSDNVLTRIGKQISTKQICRGVQIVRESGIQLNIGFIMFEPDTNLAELGENYSFLDGLGLLTDPDLTANLLYHNQIVLHGSTAWERFEREGRLLLDEHLSFEARYRFRDERVEWVCLAMAWITAEYFTRMAAIRRNNTVIGQPFCGPTIPGTLERFNREEVNLLLKDAFQAFCSAAENQTPRQFSVVKKSYMLQLQRILA